MWLMEIKTVPDKVFEQSTVPLPDKMSDALRQRSKQFFALGSGKKLCAVVGLAPCGLITQTAVVWMIFLRGVNLPFSEIRAGKKLLLAFAQMHDYTLLADIQTGDHVARKFAQYCGFQRTEISQDFDVYEQVI